MIARDLMTAERAEDRHARLEDARADWVRERKAELRAMFALDSGMRRCVSAAYGIETGHVPVLVDCLGWITDTVADFHRALAEFAADWVGARQRYIDRYIDARAELDVAAISDSEWEE